MPAIQPITMPKWGLAMEEGMVTSWAVDVGATVAVGQEIMDIETSKIANVFESPVAGVLRRHVVGEGVTVPVGALIGVVSEPDVSDAEIDAFVQEFQEGFTVAEDAGDGGSAAEVVEAGDWRINRVKAGPDTGEAILFLHGFGADTTTWMFNQAAFAEERPVHAIDLPGHGGSQKNLAEGSLDTLADAVLAYMDAADLESAHLVGHSLGGAIAVTVALRAPDRVTGLTLVSPAGFGPEIAGEFIEGFISQSRAKKLRPYLEMLVADPEMITSDMVEDVIKFKRLDGALDALKAIAGASFDGNSQKNDLRARLADIKVPIDVVWGDKDQILSVGHAEGLPAEIEVTIVPGGGHISHMEKASDVNAVIAKRINA